MNGKYDIYPHGSITAILKAAITTLIVMLILAYLINPKPFNRLFDKLDNYTNTPKEIVK